jgi:acetylornithine/N-succinyldiaminopimelate aminotransferase
MLLAVTVALLRGDWPTLILQGVSIGGMAWVCFCLSRGRLGLAGHSYFCLVIPVVVGLVVLEGVSGPFSSMSHYHLLPLTVGAYLLFFEHSARAAGVCGICLAVFVTVELGLLTLPPYGLRLRSGRAQRNGRWLLFFANFASLLLVARRFVADLAEAEKQLAAANVRLEQLLENMLPPTVCQRLRREGHTFADAFGACSVLFADIVGYTSLSESQPNVVNLLDAIFSRFDDLTEQSRSGKDQDHWRCLHGCRRHSRASPRPRGGGGRTGAADANGDKATFRDWTFASASARAPSSPGVIGKKRYIYDLWGDTVNTAARMESQGLPARFRSARPPERCCRPFPVESSPCHPPARASEGCRGVLVWGPSACIVIRRRKPPFQFQSLRNGWSMSHLMNTYARLPIAFSHGDGSWVTDTDGKVYLDALSGIAVSTLGHNHPLLVAAIAAQAGRLLHSSNLYRIPQQEQLADKLAALSGMDEVFFCNSGCEANEAAIKLARLYGHRQGVDSGRRRRHGEGFPRPHHGDAFGDRQPQGAGRFRAAGLGLRARSLQRPRSDRAIARYNKNIVAVMLEIVQGEGGINSADIDFQRGLRALCDDRGWLLICDEVQCGMGRTGRWFAFQHAGIRPDVVTLAKGLGGGVPIGACLTAGQGGGLFKPGNHGSTFGGNQLATTAALTTIAVIEKDGLIDNAVAVGPADP